jgi:hypothetical protein
VAENECDGGAFESGDVAASTEHEVLELAATRLNRALFKRVDDLNSTEKSTKRQNELMNKPNDDITKTKQTNTTINQNILAKGIF